MLRTSLKKPFKCTTPFLQTGGLDPVLVLSLDLARCQVKPSTHLFVESQVLEALKAMRLITPPPLHTQPPFCSGSFHPTFPFSGRALRPGSCHKGPVCSLELRACMAAWSAPRPQVGESLHATTRFLGGSSAEMGSVSGVLGAGDGSSAKTTTRPQVLVFGSICQGPILGKRVGHWFLEG